MTAALGSVNLLVFVPGLVVAPRLMRARPSFRLAIAGAVATTLALGTAPAQADVSSWVGAGFGPAALWREGQSQLVPSLRLETGMGSPPGGALIVGGTAGIQGHLGYGTDLTLSVRAATHHYVNGGWGAALDLGGYHRFSRESDGMLGTLTLGAPWGLTLAAGATIGTYESRSMQALIGFDFARLTAYRRTGERWWPNPLPAYRPEAEGD